MDNLLLYAAAALMGVVGFAVFALACLSVWGICAAFASVLKRD